MKHLGIFLAYAPTADLRKEGLGRVLGAFLRAASRMNESRLVIVCPGWLKKGLIQFCESEGIPTSSFEIEATDGVPVTLRLYLWDQERRRRPRKPSALELLRNKIIKAAADRRRALEWRIVEARSIFSWFIFFACASLFGAVLLLLIGLGWFGYSARSLLERITTKLWGISSQVTARVLSVSQEPGEEILDLRLYRAMEKIETERMVRKAETLKHVIAWYSPTAFWPAFNDIKGPKVMCVPDVLFTEFPIGFSSEEELVRNFHNVEASIHRSEHFVTYSEVVKWKTMVDRYGVRPENVHVIPHASWDLMPFIRVRGFGDEDQATRRFCEVLLQVALGRARDGYTREFQSGSLRYIFYASQFRPNKNVITLLRAFETLVREKFIHHKLILTGDPARFRAAADFVDKHHLAREVIFLHGLSTRELAACYHLADLAVNPSLSEGGCPFTLTEALSLNTPVVMARIPVTQETLADPQLEEIMLFDPYDYRDAASRIRWALNNRETLLDRQLEALAHLRLRTWEDVVQEHVSLLSNLANLAHEPD